MLLLASLCREAFLFVKILILFIFLTSTFSLYAKEGDRTHFDQWWLKLLRYEKNLLGSYSSQVHSAEFFLSAKGENNPDRELTQTIIAMKAKTSGDWNQHPRCLFPARRRYLQQRGLLPTSMNDSVCTEFLKFKNKINLDKAYVVFSSYYIDKPSSAFGHTLLRLKNKNSGDSLNDLLDYGVNYSAIVTTANPIIYGVKGIAGGFDGSFSLMPYFFKVREYNDMESRDLWNYELNLDEKEKDFLIAHLWELERARFTYYYFTQHCSYHLVKLIDAISPKWNLSKKLRPFIIPVETLDIFLQEDHMVSDILYRPSKYARLKSEFENLTTKEKEGLDQLIDQFDIKKIERFSIQQKVKILDTLSDYYDYKYASELLIGKDKESKVIQRRKNRILLARSRLGVASPQEKIKLSPNDYPQAAHGAQRVNLNYFREKSTEKNLVELNFRPVLHSLEDISFGMNPYSEIAMGEVNFFYDDQSEKVRLKQFHIASVTALRPFDALEKKISWNFDLSLNDPVETLSHRLMPQIDLGVGVGITGKGWMTALFIQSKQNFFFEYGSGYRLDGGVQFLYVQHLTDYLSIRVDASKMWGVTDHFNELKYGKVTMKYFWNKNFSNSFFYKHEYGQDAIGVGIDFFF